MKNRYDYSLLITIGLIIFSIFACNTEADPGLITSGDYDNETSEITEDADIDADADDDMDNDPALEFEDEEIAEVIEEELSPEIFSFPNPVDMSGLTYMQEGYNRFDIYNNGKTTLEIYSIALTEDTDGLFELSIGGEEETPLPTMDNPIILLPGEHLENVMVKLLYSCPSRNWANIEIKSNDPDSPSYFVEVNTDTKCCHSPALLAAPLFEQLEFETVDIEEIPNPIQIVLNSELEVDGELIPAVCCNFVYINNITLTGDEGFSWSLNDVMADEVQFPFMLSSKEWQHLKIYFEPDLEGESHATLTIEHTGVESSNEDTELDMKSPHTVELTAKVIDRIIYPPLIKERLPFEGVTTTTCGNPDQVPNEYGVVWGNNEGLVFFARNHFWIFDEENNTLTCDPSIKGTIIAMDGTVGENGTIVWIELEDKLARRSNNGDWTFFPIPKIHNFELQIGDYTPSGMKIGPHKQIALWGNSGLAIFDYSRNTWATHILPEFVKAPLILHGQWYEDDFYLPLGCKLYKWSNQSKQLSKPVEIEICNEEEGEALYALDLNGDEIKLAHTSWVKNHGDYGTLINTIDLSLETDEQTVYGTSNYIQCVYNPGWLYSIPYKQRVHLLPGMTGEPMATYVSALMYSHYRMMFNLSFGLRLGPEVDMESCDMGKRLFTYSWYHNMMNPSYNADINPNYIHYLFSNRAWRDGEDLWLGSARIRQGEIVEEE